MLKETMTAHILCGEELFAAELAKTLNPDSLEEMALGLKEHVIFERALVDLTADVAGKTRLRLWLMCFPLVLRWRHIFWIRYFDPSARRCSVRAF